MLIAKDEIRIQLADLRNVLCQEDDFEQHPCEINCPFLLENRRYCALRTTISALSKDNSLIDKVIEDNFKAPHNWNDVSP